MLISQYVTLYLIPIAFLCSWLHRLPISFFESLCGAIIGYFFLYSINYIFKYLTKKDGIGEGDFDLLCLIGSFSGILGCWASITIGSTLGSLFSLLYLLTTKKITKTNYIPFGPFLAFGAIIYIFLFKNL